jgi:hypothetical protein
MPYYDFLNENTGELISLFFHMKDDKKYIDDTGYEWVRQFTSPNASIDTKWDANNSKDFVEKTRNKKGSVGDIMDKSQELSEKREKSIGIDPVKEKVYSDYSRSRGGREHPNKRAEQLKKLLK